MKSTEEIIKSTYFKKVLELIKSALPVIIYPNEAESLAVKICNIESPAMSLKPLEISKIERAEKQINDAVDLFKIK